MTERARCALHGTGKETAGSLTRFDINLPLATMVANGGIDLLRGWTRHSRHLPDAEVPRCLLSGRCQGYSGRERAGAALVCTALERS